MVMEYISHLFGESIKIVLGRKELLKIVKMYQGALNNTVPLCDLPIDIKQVVMDILVPFKLTVTNPTRDEIETCEHIMEQYVYPKIKWNVTYEINA